VKAGRIKLIELMSEALRVDATGAREIERERRSDGVAAEAEVFRLGKKREAGAAHSQPDWTHHPKPAD
jgi:hypothetical protein